MPQSKERHAEWMRERRGAQDKGAQPEGAQDWETLPLKDITSALPQDIISYIESISSRYGLRDQRLRWAYKYKVWHDENFINGVHKDSKSRQFVEATT